MKPTVNQLENEMDILWSMKRALEDNNKQLRARVAELETWIRNAAPLIQAVGLDPIPHRRKEALKLWEEIPIDPSK